MVDGATGTGVSVVQVVIPPSGPEAAIDSQNKPSLQAIKTNHTASTEIFSVHGTNQSDRRVVQCRRS